MDSQPACWFRNVLLLAPGLSQEGQGTICVETRRLGPCCPLFGGWDCWRKVSTIVSFQRNQLWRGLSVWKWGPLDPYLLVRGLYINVMVKFPSLGQLATYIYMNVHFEKDCPLEAALIRSFEPVCTILITKLNFHDKKLSVKTPWKVREKTVKNPWKPSKNWVHFHNHFSHFLESVYEGRIHNYMCFFASNRLNA